MDEETIIDVQMFDCKQCGACCKHLDIVDYLPDYNREMACVSICKLITNAQSTMKDHQFVEGRTKCH